MAISVLTIIILWASLEGKGYSTKKPYESCDFGPEKFPKSPVGL
jgi:hypothetical protein